MAKIRLKHQLTPIQEQWLMQNIGPRMHYLHTSMGGEGWLVKKEWEEHEFRNKLTSSQHWYLTIEDDKLASFFILKFL